MSESGYEEKKTTTLNCEVYLVVDSTVSMWLAYYSVCSMMQSRRIQASRKSANFPIILADHLNIKLSDLDKETLLCWTVVYVNQ